jgi:hypothetical protein
MLHCIYIGVLLAGSPARLTGSAGTAGTVMTIFFAALSAYH